MEILTDKVMNKKLYPTGWIEKSDVFDYMYKTDIVAKKKNSLYDVYVMMDDLNIGDNDQKEIRFRFVNRVARHLWLNICVDLPDEWGEDHIQNHAFCINEYVSGSDISEYAFTIRSGELKRDKYTVNIAITANGYPTQMQIPIVLVRTP